MSKSVRLNSTEARTGRKKNTAIAASAGAMNHQAGLILRRTIMVRRNLHILPLPLVRYGQGLAAHAFPQRTGRRGRGDDGRDQPRFHLRVTPSPLLPVCDILTPALPGQEGVRAIEHLPLPA